MPRHGTFMCLVRSKTPGFLRGSDVEHCVGAGGRRYELRDRGLHRGDEYRGCRNPSFLACRERALARERIVRMSMARTHLRLEHPRWDVQAGFAARPRCLLEAGQSFPAESAQARISVCVQLLGQALDKANWLFLLRGGPGAALVCGGLGGWVRRRRQTWTRI